jgi:hypothetical protein
MSKTINQRMENYIKHKSETLFLRVKFALLDKIYDAENYDEYDIDDDGNINVQYSLKRDENIISESHDVIQEKIRLDYRKRISDLFLEDGYFIEYDNSDIKLFFAKPLKIKKLNKSDDDSDNDSDNDSDISHISHKGEQNILKYKKSNDLLNTRIQESDNVSRLFDFGCGEEDD